jgi:endonuclease III
MNAKEAERQFKVIVNTLLSPQATDPQVVRHHIEQYAAYIGTTYEQARQAVAAIVIQRIERRLEAL